MPWTNCGGEGVVFAVFTVLVSFQVLLSHHIGWLTFRSSVCWRFFNSFSDNMTHRVTEKRWLSLNFLISLNNCVTLHGHLYIKNVLFSFYTLVYKIEITLNNFISPTKPIWIPTKQVAVRKNTRYVLVGTVTPTQYNKTEYRLLVLWRREEEYKMSQHADRPAGPPRIHSWTDVAWIRTHITVPSIPRQITKHVQLIVTWRLHCL